MANKERIGARIESEFETKQKKPHSNGNHIVKITISSTGLTENEVLDHKWVKDAYSEIVGEFTVHVKAKLDIAIIST